MSFDGNMASGSFFEGFEAQDLDHNMSGYSSFSDCPGANCSMSFESSPTHRRPSAASSASVSWEQGHSSLSVSSLDTTAPSTPVKSDTQTPLDFVDAQGLSMSQGIPIPFDPVFYPQHPSSYDPKWLDESALIPYSSDLCLSRSIFPDDHFTSPATVGMGGPQTPQWSEETMDPAKAFIDPITPPRPFTSPISPITLDAYTPSPVKTMETQPQPQPPTSPLEQKYHRRGGGGGGGIRKKRTTTGSTLNSLPPVIKATNQYVCDHPACKDKNSRFKRAEHLKRHKLSHNAVKAYPCELCGKPFSRSDNRRAHYLTHAARKRNPYYEECDVNSSKFKYGKKVNHATTTTANTRKGVKSK